MSKKQNTKQIKDKAKEKAEAKRNNECFLKAIKETKTIAGWFVLAAFMGAAIIACGIIGPKILGNSIQLIYDFESGTLEGSETLVERLIPGLILLAIIYVSNGLLSYGKMYILNNSTSRFYTCNMRIKMADKIKRLPVKYIDKTSVGEVLDKITEDMSTLGFTMHDMLDTMMMGFMQLFALSVFMMLEDWRLGLLVIAFLPFSLIISSKVASKSEKHFADAFEEEGKLFALVEESYTNIQTTKAYNYESETEKKHKVINDRSKKAMAKGVFLSGIVRPSIALLNAVSYILICLFGGWLIVFRNVPVGVVVTVILFAKNYHGPLEQIAQGLSSLQRSKAAARRVFDFLEEPEEQDAAGGAFETADGDVTFENVSFSYDPSKPLIKNLNVNVKKGQKVAIVGPTGAGKTTIVNLLMRFYDLQGGRILIGGQDISLMPRDDVRRKFAMVLQDTWLFRGTVYENVAYGRPGATEEEIEKACEEAYCDHFIMTLPNGYRTEISEESAFVSGGQKQLLTIARAILADRELLILDEATSNVDTRTEILIQKAMDRLMKGKTCFVIAHRLSTIVDADVILVIKDGSIVETGTHETLLAEKGFYYEMYKSQYAM